MDKYRDRFIKQRLRQLSFLNRAVFISKLVSLCPEPFGKVMLHENLIIFKISECFSIVSLINISSIAKATGEFYSFRLPSIENLIDRWTLGQIVCLFEQVYPREKEICRKLYLFCNERNSLTHKIFDVDKNPSEIELFKKAVKVSVLGDELVYSLDKLIINLRNILNNKVFRNDDIEKDSSSAKNNNPKPNVG